jgi:hypothetical protein
MKREKLISSLRQIEQLVANCLEAADELPSSPVVRRKGTNPTDRAQGRSEKPEFALPLRPFAKKHARNMSGPQKFALVLAHMTKGQIGVEVELTPIRKAWSKMTELLDDFNFAYPTRAKNHGWVDSPKKNVYTLLPGWTEILRGEK